MNWLAVIEKLDEMIRKRRETVRWLPMDDPYRLSHEQTTQVIDSLSEAFKAGVRTPNTSRWARETTIDRWGHAD